MFRLYILLFIFIFNNTSLAGTTIDEIEADNPRPAKRQNTGSSNGSFEMVKSNSNGSFEMVLPSSRSSSEMLSPPHTPPINADFNVSNSQKTESNSSSSPVISPRHSPVHLPINEANNNLIFPQFLDDVVNHQLQQINQYLSQIDTIGNTLSDLHETRRTEEINQVSGVYLNQVYDPIIAPQLIPERDENNLNLHLHSIHELLHNSNLTDEEKFILRTNPETIETFQTISNKRRNIANNNLPDLVLQTNPTAIERGAINRTLENLFTIPTGDIVFHINRAPPAPDQDPVVLQRLRTGSNGAPLDISRSSSGSSELEHFNDTLLRIDEVEEPEPITLNHEPIVIRTDNIAINNTNLVTNDIIVATPSIASSELIITPQEQQIILNPPTIVIRTEPIVDTSINLIATPIIADNPIITPSNLVIDMVQPPIPITQEHGINTEPVIEHNEPQIIIDEMPNMATNIEVPNRPIIRDDTIVLPTPQVQMQPEVTQAPQPYYNPEIIVQEQVLPTITRSDDHYRKIRKEFPELIHELFSSSMFDLDGYYTLGIFSSYKYKHFKANTYGSYISIGEKHDNYAYSFGLGVIRSDLKYYELKKTINTSLLSLRLQYFIDNNNSLNVVPSFAFSKFGKKYINNYNLKTYLETRIFLKDINLDAILGADSKFCKYNKGNNTDAMTKLKFSKIYDKGTFKFEPSFTVGLYSPRNIIYLNQRLRFDVKDSFGAIDLELFSKKKNYHFVVSGKLSLFF